MAAGIALPEASGVDEEKRINTPLSSASSSHHHHHPSASTPWPESRSRLPPGDHYSIIQQGRDATRYVSLCTKGHHNSAVSSIDDTPGTRATPHTVSSPPHPACYIALTFAWQVSTGGVPLWSPAAISPSRRAHYASCSSTPRPTWRGGQLRPGVGAAL